MKKPVIALWVGALSTFLIAEGIQNYREIRNYWFHPHYSCCTRCKTTWDVAQGHIVQYGDINWTVTTPNTGGSMVTIAGLPNDGGTYSVTVTNGMGTFALCEKCWSELTPSERLPYYRASVERHREYDSEKTDEYLRRVTTNIMSGKW